ncbi:hypothetical protein V565_255660 [Rhizoctonia solani 123E]|uniref:MYND finger protein n=1 Tax=Rhizoctonia solani 123E TaxID=1423351 RepID=A0A074S6C1_9AGAM|nr:hypothetical protein V565_255660 [Rhizoctonia solani 123E]
MTDQVHPHWGQIKDQYDSAYIYDIQAAKQQAIFSPCVSDALHADVAETVDKLCALGECSVEADWDNNPNYITLSMLKSVIEHMSFPCSLPTLCNPLAIHGCINLMQSITRFGRPSPFSYEYGYLCFRILVVAYDYCVLLCSERHESWIDEVEQPQNYLLQEGHIPILSRTVSEVIVDCMNGGTPIYNKFFTWSPWTDNYRGPLITTHYILLLAKILDDDRKHFLIFMRSNYSLRLSALLYTMCEFMHKMPPQSEEHPFLYMFTRIYPRALLLVPDYPFGLNSTHFYIMQLAREYKSTSQVFDAEDSQLVFRAQPLIRDGFEDVLPSVIRATIHCMWEDMVAEEPVTAELVYRCMQLVHAISHWFDFLKDRTQTAGHRFIQAIDIVIEEELVNFVMRMLLETCPNDGKSSGQALAAPLVSAVTKIFLVFQTVVPPAFLKQRFHQSIFSWVTFLVNFHNTIPATSHQPHWIGCLDFLSKVVMILGGNQDTFDGRCENPRCPVPMKVAYARSGSVYCSPECYARDWAGSLCAHTSPLLLT